jgi:hypothetical protein
MKKYWNVKLAGLAAITAGSMLAVGSPVMAEGVVLSAETTAAAEAGGMTDADFNITVTNSGSTRVQDLSIVFDDGSSVYVGLVRPGRSKMMSMSKTLDTTAMPTHNYPLAVTLNYVQNASVVEEVSQVIVPLGGQ